MQSVVWKAEIRDLEAARLQCGIEAAKAAGTVAQADTYFRVPDGRLKRRECPDRAPIWIYSLDATAAGVSALSPRVVRTTVLNDEQARVRWGETPLTPQVVVRKTREAWSDGVVRVHLDRVEDLGAFVEFEVRVGGTLDLAGARAAVARLRESFAPILGEAVSGSYESLVAGVT